MRHELHTTVTIDAPVEIVWDVLTDLDGYSEWNPFIVESTGSVEVGARLQNRMLPPGGKAMSFKPTVTEAEPLRTFEWLGRPGIPGIFDGRHRFELHAIDSGQTRLDHSEQFSGILVRLVRSGLDTKTLAGFEAMNAAIKSRAEARAVAAN